VGLLTRNIVIQGEAEGEDTAYQSWNAPSKKSPRATANSCGNNVCQQGENSKTCPADCRGPVWEYGASIVVASYAEKYTLCSPDGACASGYERVVTGQMTLDSVEMAYFGQNNVRPGVLFQNIRDQSKR